ncbi:myosin-binding protein 3-like [Gastrolobium bilobum]|uniref:myosin-binding protein 3-like n=1 Tax=Gastrolobium bilobum TaxID=150636 RepID=UPI002AB208D7|nr:myosin-binding protein 3-like [Gastrolobium bilobum]
MYIDAYLLLKPSWGDGDYTSKGTLILEIIDDEIEEADKEKFESNNEEDHEHDDEGITDKHHIVCDVESFYPHRGGKVLSQTCTLMKRIKRGMRRKIENLNLHFENHVACETHALEREQKIESFATESPIRAQSSIFENNLCEPQALSNGGSNAEAAVEEADNTQANKPPFHEPDCSCQCIQEDQSSTNDDDTEVPNAFNELEEERSASAIAANQTMTMITRRQEEKAAMQMEALQCQRMMEEQSEYDPEALQILNDLMMKREKEKQELEKELEEHRKKILDYEGKEKLRVLRRKDGIDEDNGIFNHEESSHNNLSADTVSNLEEMAIDCAKYISVVDNSLAEFEEEKVSILDEFKALREKLITVSIEEEVDHVYERLQALKTYREFLKHCKGSTQNGDKGMDFLQEILQHLCDHKQWNSA